MPRSSTRKRTASASLTAGVNSLDLMRTGMPARDSIVEVRPRSRPPGAKPTAVLSASGGAAFRIIRTNEVDGYEAAATPHETTSVLVSAAAAAAGDKFTGTARRAAKISIADAPVRTYTDLRNLIKSLPSDQSMIDRDPKITKTATSNRVKEEKRNVRVKVFLYAASREDDNDFHLILGRDPSKTPEMYMTMELSGLPPASSPAFDRLKAARDAYKVFFGADLPGTSYDFYDPPIPVRVEGSLFFDMSHATGTRPGPKSLKSRMPTIWEVHPISKIVFNP